MFPQLVAGPIIRAVDLLPQLTYLRQISEQERFDALKLMAFGFFKKLVIADSLAPAVNAAFSNPHQATSSLYWWIIISMFAAQIYCDFSGYSDIARGIAKWMGYHFKKNFNHPYLAIGIKDFWNRWHISLSHWFRDYVYIPLGGTSTSKIKSHMFMWCTMFLSGVWHGAAWHFVIWGLVHAFFISFERITKWSTNLMRVPFGRAIAVFVTIIQVLVAWVFFRAESLSDALNILQIMFNFSGLPEIKDFCGKRRLAALSIFVCAELYIFMGFHISYRTYRKKLSIMGAIVEPLFVMGIIICCVLFRGVGNEFIYFQF